MIKKLLLASAVALSASFAAKATIGDQFTKDGVRYEIFQEYTENGTLKVVAPGTYKKYTGALTVPYIFNYNGKEWYVVDMDWTAIDLEKITSLDLQYHPNNSKVPKYLGATSSSSSKAGVLKSVKLSEGFTKLEDFAFADCQKLESIEMPGVTEMGEYAFSTCNKLASVTLNEGLETIPRFCFLLCNSLKKIDIPSSVVTIENNAFYFCTGLEYVYFTTDSKCQKLRYEAFACCGSLKRITLANSINFIGSEVFMNCTSLEYVVIPYNYTYDLTAKNIFKGCSNLQTIVDLNPTPLRVTTYVWNAGSIDSDGVSSMSKCTLLVPNNNIRDYNYVEFNINDDTKFTFKAVEAYTFTYKDYITYRADTPTSCSLLKSYATEVSEATVTIPDKAEVNGLALDVKGICPNAFLNNKIPSITIPAGITWIGDKAFSGCSNLSMVRFECPDFSIGNYAFAGTALESVKITGRCSIGLGAFSNCSELQNVRATNLYESPGKYAFSKCPNLNIVYIGGDINWLRDNLFEDSHVNTIGILCDTPPEPYQAFADLYTPSLTLVVPPASIRKYVNHNSGVYSKFGIIESTNWLDDSEQYYFMSEYNKYSEKIDAWLYMIHTDENIGKEWTAPSSVTKFGETMSVRGIRNYACAGLKALKVTIPNSVLYIDNCAFQYSNMQELWLPEYLSGIEEKAFLGCNDLTDIYVTCPYPCYCAESAFDGVSRTGCTLHVPAEGLEAYRSSAPWNEFLNIEVNGIETVNIDASDNEAPWYNLQGIEVSRDRLAPGIYIHAGKKVMVTGPQF